MTLPECEGAFERGLHQRDRGGEEQIQEHFRSVSWPIKYQFFPNGVNFMNDSSIFNNNNGIFRYHDIIQRYGLTTPPPYSQGRTDDYCTENRLEIA